MKDSNHSKLSLFAVVALVGSATALPQEGYQFATGGNGDNFVDWPAGIGTPGDFKRIVTGEFAGGSMAGALALVGDKAVYLFEPAVHDDVTVIASSGVNDVAALAPAAPGLAAGMLVAKTDGLYLAVVDLVAGSVNGMTTPIATGNFADLDLVRSGKINGTGLDDIVGANGANVYVLLESGSGWSAGPSFTAYGTVLDMAAVDWDDDGDGDVALLHDQRVEIRESDGDLIETQLGVATGGYLAHLPPTTQNSAERLAWALKLPSAAYALLVLSYPNTRTSCGTFLEVPDSLSSAIFVDDEGNTRPDLLTSLPSDTPVQIFPHRTATPPYALASPLNFEAGTFPSATDGQPAFGDITFDGIPDAIAGRGGEDTFVILRGYPQMMLKVLTPDETFSEPILVEEDITGLPWFGIKVQMTDDLQGFDYLQAMLWYSKDVDVYEAGERLEAGAIANYYYAVTPDTQVPIWLPLADGGVENACEFDQGFALAVRLVDLNFTPTPPIVTSASSPMYGIFSKDYDTVVNMAAPEFETIVFETGSCSSIQEPGLPPQVGYTPVASLPPKRTNVPPSVPNLGVGPDEPDWE